MVMLMLKGRHDARSPTASHVPPVGPFSGKAERSPHQHCLRISAFAHPCHKTIRCPVIARTNNRDWTAGASGDARKGNHDAQEKPMGSALFGSALSHSRHADGSAASGDATPVARSDGHTFYEGPNDVHVVGRNASSTQPAKFLVLLIKDQGAPTLVPVQ